MSGEMKESFGEGIQVRVVLEENAEQIPSLSLIPAEKVSIF
jgi:hypothetical protein